jgi:hypothetical protein
MHRVSHEIMVILGLAQQLCTLDEVLLCQRSLYLSFSINCLLDLLGGLISPLHLLHPVDGIGKARICGAAGVPAGQR